MFQEFLFLSSNVFYFIIKSMNEDSKAVVRHTKM